jgi:hypothetical protein
VFVQGPSSDSSGREERISVFKNLGGAAPAAVSREEMKLEGFSENDFAEQKKNRWKLQGKKLSRHP